MIKLNSFFILMLLTIKLNFVYAQNIVPNNGFETYSSLPTGYGQWYKATGWLNLNGVALFIWPYASADYLHNTGSGGVDLPVSTFATVNPQSGNAVMGFVTYYLPAPEFREYISIQFTTPMIAGTPYTVSFWVTNGTAGYYCNSSANHFGIRLSVAPLSQVDHEPIGGIPQLEYPGEIWSPTWQYVSFNYIPDQNYNYITIGNFYNDASTTHTIQVAGISTGAYYFIDEVVVTPAVPLPVSLTQFGAELNGDKIDLTWKTESELNCDNFRIQKSIDGNNFTDIGTVKCAGTSNNLLSYLFSDEKPVSGYNFYRLIAVDINELENFSEIVLVNYSDISPLISPNPCSQFFNIDGMGGNYNVTIFDVEGKEVFSKININDHQTIDITNLHSGIYFVFISSENTNIVKELAVK